MIWDEQDMPIFASGELPSPELEEPPTARHYPGGEMGWIFRNTRFNPSALPAKDGETRITDPITGGEKGQKLARFSLIPSDVLWALSEHYGRGASKYADRNWERGYAWSLSYDALNRHLHQWVRGEDNDPETGSSHLIAVIWHTIALWWFHRHAKGTDDLRGYPRA